MLIACDLLVAAGADALVALRQGPHRRASATPTSRPTADFVTDRDVRFDADAMARRIRAGVKTYDAAARPRTWR